MLKSSRTKNWEKYVLFNFCRKSQPATTVRSFVFNSDIVATVYPVFSYFCFFVHPCYTRHFRFNRDTSPPPPEGRDTTVYSPNFMPNPACVQPTRLVLVLRDDFYQMPGLLAHCFAALKVRRAYRPNEVCSR